MTHIHYTSGYKYQLTKDYTVKVRIAPPETIDTRFIRLHRNGTLVIRNGYAWDGPSGPTMDTKTFMRGSLVHDALYQLMRMGLLRNNYRRMADIELHRICKEDGMWGIRVWYVYRGVRLGAGFAANPKHRRKVKTAP